MRSQRSDYSNQKKVITDVHFHLQTAIILYEYEDSHHSTSHQKTSIKRQPSFNKSSEDSHYSTSHQKTASIQEVIRRQPSFNKLSEDSYQSRSHQKTVIIQQVIRRKPSEDESSEDSLSQHFLITINIQ